jgi:tetratricopeptide (TPR) repeat protein
MKKILLETALLFAFATPLLAAQLSSSGDAGSTVMLELRDGGVLFGNIEGHSPDELYFERLDTGGHLALPWGLLDPAKERELKLAYGYIASDFEEELVGADRLSLIDGTELVGVIVGRTDRTVMVKNAQALISLPVDRIVGQSVYVQVPAGDIYTREERYQMKLKDFTDALVASDPRTVAQAHVDLAVWCEGVRDYPRALEHYQAVALADPTWPLEDLQPSLERAATKAEAQVQVDYLGEIEHHTRRGNYDKALSMLADFSATYPDSPLMEDWNVQRERTMKAQLKALRSDVAKRWHAAAARQARAAARLQTYAEVVAYLDGSMGQEILVRVTADLADIDADIMQEEVAALFVEREGGRWRKASFGNGTWLLGEKKALAGIEGEKKEDPKGEEDAKRKSLEEKIKRYIENQEAVRSASGGSGEESPEDFWASFSLNARGNWILAYYAEFSGDMQLRRALFSNCRECGGSGVREIVSIGSAREGSTGGTRMITCPTCHGIGAVRRISYR